MFNSGKLERLFPAISNDEEILSALPPDLSAPPPALSALPLEDDIPSELKQLIESLGKRTNDKEKITDVILRLCAHKPMKSKTIAQVLGKSEKYIFKEFLKPLLDKKK